MANYEEFDERQAFKAQGRFSDACMLAGGTLPSDMQLIEFHRLAGYSPGLINELGLVASVLYRGREGLDSNKHDLAIKYLRNAESTMHDVGGLSVVRLGTVSLAEAAELERNLHLQRQAESLGALIEGKNVWVSLEDRSDTPEARAHDDPLRIDMTVCVAPLKGFEMRRTPDGHPDPIAVLEGSDGVQGLYPYKMGMYMATPALNPAVFEPGSA